MPKTLVIPLELSGNGSFVVTEDPAVIMKQRILDLLVTSRWERVMRPDYGCDLEGFLFTSIIDHLLATKASEIQATLSRELNFGSIESVMLTPVRIANGTESAIVVEVMYRVFEGGDPAVLSTTFDVPEQ